jgi:hypothetical protein
MVEGDARSADEIIVAGAPIGITAINRCASKSAIGLIQRNYGHLLGDTIRPLDPLSVLANALEAAPFEPVEVEPRIDTVEAVENSGFQSDLDGHESPNISTSEEVWRDDHVDHSPVLERNLRSEAGNDRDTSHSRRLPLAGITASEPTQSYSEFVSDPDEFDFPEPVRPTDADEEMRRQRAAELWENYVAQNFESLRWNPVRAARGYRAPPKPEENGPS